MKMIYLENMNVRVDGNIYFCAMTGITQRCCMPSSPENMQGTFIYLSYLLRTDQPHLLDNRHHIFLSQRIMQRTRTQDEMPMQDRSVHKCFATRLYLLHDPLVQGIKLFLIPSQRIWDIAKTHNREFHRRYAFQIRCSVDQRSHILCQRIVSLDMGHQSGTTRLLDHPQQLECIE